MSLLHDIQAAVAASGAHMGIAIHHLESGETLELNADEPFPLCSVLKIPVLVEAFRQLREGRFRLDDRWELTLAEKNLPSGVLVFLQDGLQPTVQDLLTLMIIISDNTATDMLMHRLGVARINQTMHELGLADTHIALTIREIFDDMLGEASDPRRAFTDLDRFQEPPPVRRDGRAFSTGPDNDVGTPRDMTRLLTLIFRGEVVDREACDQMLHILLQQQLNTRLPLFLPEGVPFAHKTGTLSGIRNDAGILYASPTSHVAISVFSRWDAGEVAGDPVAEWRRTTAIDEAFGRIGRLVYDHYTTR
ncbi:MAG: beta-lactamase [Litorilinea sp.]|nr:MAG: beta-lactamase [Litorilinea sp.]